MSLHPLLLKKKAIVNFACAGAGLDFQTRLWQTPGSSQYLAGATMLQASSELDKYIGHKPETGYASKQVALELAMVAYIRAVHNADGNEDSLPIGISVTASVASNRIPRGEQRAHLAVLQGTGFFYTKLAFHKTQGGEDRKSHDFQIADKLEVLVEQSFENEPDPDLQKEAMEQIIHWPIFLPNGLRERTVGNGSVFFPANFNPLHDGHRLAYREASKIAGQPIVLMIEARPPNKPPISAQGLLERISRIQSDSQLSSPILITEGKPNYVDKARAYPGSSFVLGADAAARLFETDWGYDVTEMLTELDNLKTRFLVLGRKIDGRFTTLEELNPPQEFRHLFQSLEGRCDVSSTELRKEIDSEGS